MIDFVIDGPGRNACYIISSESMICAHEFLYSLNRGCTELQARTVERRAQALFLMCSWSYGACQLKAIVSEIDPNALVFISERGSRKSAEGLWRSLRL